MKIKIKTPLVFFFFISFLISANAQIDSSPIINKVYTSPKLKAFELKSDSLIALNITPSLTKQNYQGFYQDCLGILQRGVRRGRRFVILHFRGNVPAGIEHQLAPGWRHDEMSLEDVFIAVVKRVDG